MADDWLWDGSGAPDPEEERLAKLLGAHRYDRPAPIVGVRPRWRGLPVLGAAVLLAAAAALVIGLQASAPATWSCGEGCSLAVGSWLETGDRSVTLEVADIGTMEVLPDSRLKLVETGDSRHRLELAVGSIHAQVTAPPRLLVVDTPSAAAVDLGCEYDLTVLEDGTSILAVQSGWVELDHPVRKAIVPAGAACVTVPGKGPGIPWWVDDEQPHYADTLVLCDGGDNALIPDVLAASRPRDTLSLWHLLQRVPDDDRGPILDRIEALDPSAASAVRRDQLLALDGPSLETLFDRLSDSW